MPDTVPMETIALPESVYDIDMKWLNDALQARGHEVRITACERQDVVHMTCTKARYAVEYDRDIGLPERLLVKGAFEEHSERMREMYQAEARFYALVAPQIPLNVPASYWSGIDPGGWRAAVLMEDLTARNVSFCRAQEPFTFEHIHRRISMLAKLHAMTWNTPKLQPGGDWDWVVDRFSSWAKRFAERYLQPDKWQFYVESPRGASVSNAFHDREWMSNTLDRLGELAEGDPYCLIHGDTHNGNLYVDADGTPAFLDPTVARAPWWLEVSYHLGCTMDIGDRRRWEGALLMHYLDSLEHEGGPRIDFDHAWLRYRQGLAYGYWVFIINETKFQTESTNTAYAARFGAAMVDHDTKRLLLT
jgi:fructosamine-3-kinase